MTKLRTNLTLGITLALTLVAAQSASTQTSQDFGFAVGSFADVEMSKPLKPDQITTGAVNDGSTGMAIGCIGCDTEAETTDTSSSSYTGVLFGLGGLNENDTVPSDVSATGFNNAQPNMNFKEGSFGDAQPVPAQSKKPSNKQQTQKKPKDKFDVNSFGEAPPKTRPKKEVKRQSPPKKKQVERKAQPGKVDRETVPGGKPDFETKTKRKVVRQKPETTRKQARRQTVKVDKGITAFELRNFGVQPTNKLRSRRMHGPTPRQLPGGRLATTQTLAQAMVDRRRFILIDVLGGRYTLPNAYRFKGMASGGSFRDNTQSHVARWLARVTNRNANTAIVVFCSDPMCWMSYNAGLRAIAAGYKNVFWYRGGIRAWQMAGFKMVAADYKAKARYQKLGLR